MEHEFTTIQRVLVLYMPVRTCNIDVWKLEEAWNILNVGLCMITVMAQL